MTCPPFDMIRIRIQLFLKLSILELAIWFSVNENNNTKNNSRYIFILNFKYWIEVRAVNLDMIGSIAETWELTTK
jgi:hypothetical protein